MKRQRLRFRRVAGLALLMAGGLGLGLALLSFPGCGSGDDGWPADKTGPKVVASFAPLYCFAVNVAGDDAVVRNLLTTTGPHHFQPTDRDARLLRRANLFLVNGIGLEGDNPEKMKKGSGNKNLKIVELGERIPKGELCEGSCHHEHEPGEEHEHGMDPHLWLSPDFAVLMTEGIRDELIAIDAAHAEGYKTRAAEYVAKLRKLKEDGLALMKDKKDRRLVTFHDSMTYFARTFNLEIVGVVEKNPGSEPNDKQLKKLIALCSNPGHEVRLICTEPQYANSNAGTELVRILKSKGVADADLAKLDPLETVAADQLTADWYEKKMRENLQKLAEKMK